jgi:hypothetical protein
MWRDFKHSGYGFFNPNVIMKRAKHGRNSLFNSARTILEWRNKITKSIEGHKAIVAATVTINLDSDTDSDDSQASMLRDMDETELENQLKKVLQDADVGNSNL